MKKVLLSMLVLLSTVAMQAQNWTAPSENDYPSETPIYVQVNLNGELTTDIEVAAFIDGECRAAATEATINTDAGNMFLLRVRGGDDDMGKTISFKVFERNYGLLFSCTKTTTFTGETESEVPFVLNVDRPTHFDFSSDPLQITVLMPAEIDLNEYITVYYNGTDDQGNVWHEPRGESVLETTLTYTWTNQAGEPITQIDENNILTVTEAWGDQLWVKLSVPEYQEIYSTGIQLDIIEEMIWVESINCSLQTVKMNKGENINDIEELKNAITIEPANASWQTYRFETEEDEIFDNDGVALKGGTFEVKIISDCPNEVSTTILVEVYAPVEYLRVSQETFQAKIGDNIFDKISPYVTIGPDDATNKEFYLEVPAEASDAIFENTAYIAGKYTISVVSADNPQVKSDVTVVITEIIAPEEIYVDINTNVYDVLRNEITITPENEDGSDSYTITPADEETANAIVNEYATKNGTFTLIVTSTANPEVSVEVKVIVTTPTDIEFPTYLVISKYTDTEFELTVTGDSFDPSLVEFEFNSAIEPVGFGIPTYSSADGGNGLLWNIRGTGAGSVELRVLYNGQYMPRGTEGDTYCVLEIPAEVAFNSNGWDWIYAPTEISLSDPESPAFSYLSNLNIDENNRVIEIRSQSELLYNDPVYGFLGSIITLTPEEGMYKIKATYEDASNCILKSSKPYWERYPQRTIKPGYTWFGYPNEWDMTLDDLNSLGVQYIPANDGDLIIGKTNFAEYSEGAWVGADFTLEAGKGYIYYNSTDADNYLTFDYIPYFSNQTYNLNELGTKSITNASVINNVWEYDASQFADNMAIVAQITDLENPEDYTIGAFVGDECRGMGKVVKDGKMMINVAGKSGETVSFRLHNEYTGEYVDLNSTVRYAQKLGSLKSPVKLSGEILTGISTIDADNNNEATYYDLNGRIVKGNLSSGVYIVKTIENGQVVVNKLIKK